MDVVRKKLRSVDILNSTNGQIGENGIFRGDLLAGISYDQDRIIIYYIIRRQVMTDTEGYGVPLEKSTAEIWFLQLPSGIPEKIQTISSLPLSKPEGEKVFDLPYLLIPRGEKMLLFFLHRVELFEPTTSTRKILIPEHDGDNSTISASISPSGKKIIVINQPSHLSQDRQSQLYLVHSGDPLKKLKSMAGVVGVSAWTPSEDAVLVGTDIEESYSRLDLSSGQLRHMTFGTPQYVPLDWLSETQLMVTNEDDYDSTDGFFRSIHIWNSLNNHRTSLAPSFKFRLIGRVD